MPPVTDRSPPDLALHDPSGRTSMPSDFGANGVSEDQGSLDEEEFDRSLQEAKIPNGARRLSEGNSSVSSKRKRSTDEDDDDFDVKDKWVRRSVRSFLLPIIRHAKPSE